MPTLTNPRYEAFAQARAKGALLNDAYESAGFVLHRGHPSRLAFRKEVAERIAELRAELKPAVDRSPGALLDALLRIVKAGEGAENPSVLKEARLAIVDAARLQRELAADHFAERNQMERNFKEFNGDRIKENEADYS
jgi:hypothetical protein